MNRENVLALAAHLAGLEAARFDQRDWMHYVRYADNFDGLPPIPSADAVLDAAEWCGTASCIAGHALELSGQAEDWRDPSVMARHDFEPDNPRALDGWIDYIDAVENRNMADIAERAGRWLGLNPIQQARLFMASPQVPKGAYVGDGKKIDPAYAAQVLLVLAATGDVDWMMGHDEEEA